MLEESLRLVENAGDVRGVAYAYFALTDVAGRFGGVEASLAYAEAAVAHARSAAEDGLLAPALGNLEAGALASATSIRTSIVSGGVACVVGCVVLALAFPALIRYDSRVREAAVA